MSQKKTNWGDERAAYERRLPPVVFPEFHEPWIGTDYPTEEAMRIIKRQDYEEDDIVSGKETALAWLRKKQISEEKSGVAAQEAALREMQNKVCDITKKIETTQDKILSNCWNQLPSDCPFKQRGSLEFFSDWHNIDGRIFPSIDAQALIPNSLIHYEFVYEGFIQSDEYEEGLITIENYKPSEKRKEQFEEHRNWVKRHGPLDYKGRWKSDRKDCEKNINQTLSKNPLHLFIVAAAEYSRFIHLKNGIPLSPTVHQVKRVLDWKFPELQNKYSVDAMKKAIQQARCFIFIGEKGRGKNLL